MWLVKGWDELNYPFLIYWPGWLSTHHDTVTVIDDCYWWLLLIEGKLKENLWFFNINENFSVMTSHTWGTGSVWWSGVSSCWTQDRTGNQTLTGFYFVKRKCGVLLRSASQQLPHEAGSAGGNWVTTSRRAAPREAHTADQLWYREPHLSASPRLNR